VYDALANRASVRMAAVEIPAVSESGPFAGPMPVQRAERVPSGDSPDPVWRAPAGGVGVRQHG
jgi:hypothetical protein